MRILLITIVTAVLFTGCDTQSVTPPAAESIQAAGPAAETERLSKWFNERYEEQLLRSPMGLTYEARKERYSETDDLSEAAGERELELFGETVAEMKNEFDYDTLDEAGQESYNLWIYQYEQEKAQQPYRRHGYLFSELFSAASSLTSFLINHHRVDTPADMEAYISRLGETARAIGQIAKRARLGS